METGVFLPFLVDISESELSEDILIQDLLYVFQGINGKYMTMKKNTDSFRFADEVQQNNYNISVSLYYIVDSPSFIY